MSMSAYIQPAQPQQQARQRASKPHVDTSCQLYFAPRNRNRCQPLYRPAALRRNSMNVLVTDSPVSPPTSPAPAHAEAPASSSLLSSPSTWFGNVLPWGPTQEVKCTESNVIGVALPRSKWRPDEEALICAASDCSLRFDLINRRHHCRKCGEVFCAAHSSRSVPLWASEHSSPPTPRATPKPTPRSSTIDLPGLVQSMSSAAISSFPFSMAESLTSSSVSSASTPTSSPPNLRSFMPVPSRICDSCWFNAPAPAPALLTPSLSAAARSPLSSPKGSISISQSPPCLEWSSQGIPARAARAKSRSRSRHNSSSGGSRSRQGSASGSSSTPSSSSFVSTAPTSLDSFPTNMAAGQNRLTPKRAISPATSLRAKIDAVGPHYEDREDDSDSDDELTEEEQETSSSAEGRNGMLVASETSFNDRYQSTWSTF